MEGDLVVCGEEEAAGSRSRPEAELLTARSDLEERDVLAPS